ncbi:signal peptidase I [bacterium]|nr:signal peptidase I [bacterium]NUP93024.1 signal peptidase I [Candidatus Omnitrophota bacterium]
MMDPYHQPRNSEKGCFSFSCGCCSGGCLATVLLGSLSVLLFAYGYWVGMVDHPGEFAYVHVLRNDMSPTIQPGDWVLVDRDYYADEPIQRGDIVWLASSGESESESKQLLRVAGLPGESVTFSASGELLIDGNVFTRHPMLAERDFRKDKKVPDPVKLNDNEYYLLGDNRDEARDCRSIGPVPVKNLRGMAISILFPPNRVARVDGKN